MKDRGAEGQVSAENVIAGGDGPTRPVGVYFIAVFFTVEWLFLLASLLVTLHHFSPEMRARLLKSGATTSLTISELNGLLTVIASWLLFAMRRVGAALLLASTLLIAGLAAISWPALLQHSWHIRNDAQTHALLLGGSNLVLHIAATIYAFHLDRRGLLR